MQKPKWNFPTVAVVMIDWRNNNWTKEAIRSVERQYYPVDEFVIVANRKNTKTIGQAWNEGVKQAESEWILFIGDDDVITSEYILSLLIALQEALDHNHCNINVVTSYCTVFDSKTAIPVYNRVPTGMWRREFLAKHPFNEELKRLVDKDYFDNHIHKGGASMCIAAHQFGYMYRQHNGKTSGVLGGNIFPEAIKGKQNG